MKDKAFTLIETLAVVILLGVILTVAVPAISRVSRNSKEKEMIEDAKMFLTLVEDKIRVDHNIDPNTQSEFFLSDVEHVSLETSPFGSDYDSTNSKVSISGCNDQYQCKYYVLLQAKDGNDIVTASGNIDSIQVNRSDG